jgi:hypothetical protein
LDTHLSILAIRRTRARVTKGKANGKAIHATINSKIPILANKRKAIKAIKVNHLIHVAIVAETIGMQIANQRIKLANSTIWQLLTPLKGTLNPSKQLRHHLARNVHIIF